jgi:UDP-2,4-diacetamido-2,4,6-trideoxy-beta-L-altropyranose hydrolase
MRCLTLAQALRGKGAICGFIATAPAVALLDAFADEGIEKVGVTGDSAEAIAAAAERWQADAVAVDHYGFERGHEARLRSAGALLMVLDDLKRSHDCDLLLDSNIGRTAADYPDLDTLTGPAFALVRPAFAERRAAVLARRARGGTPKQILVSLGLADLNAITARVVETVLPDLREARLDVVLGDTAPSLTRLAALAARDGRIRLHVNARDVPALTAEADLAIGAGGSSTWERCCLGLPTLLIVLADNQRPNAEAMTMAGAALIVEAGAADFDNDLRAALSRLRKDAELRQSMTKVAADLCDGQGAAQVALWLLAMIGSREAPSA